MHSSMCPTVHGFFLGFFAFFFSLFFSKVRVGAKEGGSHYWEMAVAITCGYGGYLLPLLAAHSSFENATYLVWPVCFLITQHLDDWYNRHVMPLHNRNFIPSHWSLCCALYAGGCVLPVRGILRLRRLRPENTGHEAGWPLHPEWIQVVDQQCRACRHVPRHGKCCTR